MTEYIKFWLAQALADILIVVILFGMVFSLIFGIEVYRWLRNRK